MWWGGPIGGGLVWDRHWKLRDLADLVVDVQASWLRGLRDAAAAQQVDSGCRAQTGLEMGPGTKPPHPPTSRLDSAGDESTRPRSTRRHGQKARPAAT